MVRVLLLGGHGKVALRMTKLLAAQNHTVTSIIRDPNHISEIQSLHPDLVKPVVASIEEADDQAAKNLVSEHEWVVWSAGAGGKGGPERTKAVDEIAAKRFIQASLASPNVKKFLMVSACVARSKPALYWSADDIEKYKQSWEAIPVYCQCKTVADEFLYDEARKANQERKGKGWDEVEDINLRPGLLTDEPGTGKVDLGRSKVSGAVTRDDVAAVGVELLKRGGAGGLWVDLVGGEEGIESAVERVVKERVSARE